MYNYIFSQTENPSDVYKKNYIKSQLLISDKLY